MVLSIAGCRCTNKLIRFVDPLYRFLLDCHLFSISKKHPLSHLWPIANAELPSPAPCGKFSFGVRRQSLYLFGTRSFPENPVEFDQAPSHNNGCPSIVVLRSLGLATPMLLNLFGRLRTQERHMLVCFWLLCFCYCPCDSAIERYLMVNIARMDYSAPRDGKTFRPNIAENSYVLHTVCSSAMREDREFSRRQRHPKR